MSAGQETFVHLVGHVDIMYELCKECIIKVLPRVLIPIACICGAYALFIIILATPFVQRQMLFAHRIRWPLNPTFEIPERYGLAPFKTINFNITTIDGVSLGAWFVFCDEFYRSRDPLSPFSDRDVSEALKAYPTILYCHGNTASRAVFHRVQTYSTYSTRLRVNVLAIDYRGFADSTGSPSEAGLGLDAQAAWDWLIDKGAQPKDILLVGQSLGTGVASNLGASLAGKGVSPRGIALIAPYTSIPKLLESYSLFGVIPLLLPLQIIPFLLRFTLKFWRYPFNTLAALPTVNAPILLVHADDDYEIKKVHSKSIFDVLMQESVPSQSLDSAVERRETKGFATVSRFVRPQGDVVLIETNSGGHNWPGASEGVADLVGKHFQLGR